MKKQSIVIPINSYSDLDKQNLIAEVEKRLPIGTFVESIKTISVGSEEVPYSKINQKKNLNFLHLCVNNGSVKVEFAFSKY